MKKANLVTPAYFVHKLGICDSESVGEGTRIWAFSHVMKGAVVGSHCNIGEQVFVEDRAVIGNRCTIKNGVSVWSFVHLEDSVFVGPSAVFTNDFRPRAFLRRPESEFRPTRVCRGATVGANAVLVCGITVGEFAFIGAGSVVTRNVPAHALVVGNPGRVIGKVCFCGSRLQSDDTCPSCRVTLAKNSLEEVLRRFSKSVGVSREHEASAF